MKILRYIIASRLSFLLRLKSESSIVYRNYQNNIELNYSRQSLSGCSRSRIDIHRIYGGDHVDGCEAAVEHHVLSHVVDSWYRKHDWNV